MIEPVGEDRVAAAGERRQDREVGEIARRKRERPRAGARRDERREFRFERRVRGAMAGDEMRCARADAPARRRVARRRDQRRMVREAEVIVARERDDLAPVDDDARTLRRVDDAAAAREARGGAGGEIALERIDERRRSRARRSARRGAVHRREAELREQRAVGLGFRVAGRQELVAVEDRVRAGEEAQRLHRIAELAAAGREPHHRLRHRDPRDRDRADELERIERGARRRSARGAACPRPAPGG